jgi:hypothetical protein
MARHDVNEHATAETRRKGAEKAAEAKRQRRLEGREPLAQARCDRLGEAVETFSNVAEKAAAAVEGLLDAESEACDYGAALVVLQLLAEVELGREGGAARPARTAGRERRGAMVRPRRRDLERRLGGSRGSAAGAPAFARTRYGSSGPGPVDDRCPDCGGELIVIRLAIDPDDLDPDDARTLRLVLPKTLERDGSGLRPRRAHGQGAQTPAASSRRALLTKEWTLPGTVLEQTVRGGGERTVLVSVRRR